MKFEDKFRDFLLTRFRSGRTGKSLTPKVASDVISRCRFLERTVEIELGPNTFPSEKAYERLCDVVRIKSKDFGASPARPYAYNQHLYSVRIYRLFLSKRA